MKYICGCCSIFQFSNFIIIEVCVSIVGLSRGEKEPGDIRNETASKFIVLIGVVGAFYRQAVGAFYRQAGRKP